MAHVAELFEPEIQLGSTGLRRDNGRINEEQSRNLKGDRAIRKYREMMDSEPAIAAALSLISNFIRQVEWRVEPADKSDEAREEAVDTELAFKDTSHSWNDFISEVLSMLWAGYSYFEIVYKIRRGPDQTDPKFRSKFSDGKFGWRKIEIRSQDTLTEWVFDDEGGIRGANQKDAQRSEVFLPIEKSLLFRTEVHKGNPEGRSLLRPAVLPYTFSKRLKEFEAIGIERNLAGMPIMQVPPELLNPNAKPALKKTRAALEDWITKVKMDENWGGLIPGEKKPGGEETGFKFELVTTSGRRVDTDPIIRRYRNEILMLFRAQFMVLGTEGHGSFALSSNMTNLFAVALGAVLDSIAEVINMFLIPRRQRLNGIKQELDPHIVHGDLEGRDLDQLSKYLQALTSTGLVQPSEKLERAVLEAADLPVPDIAEEAADDDGTEIDLSTGAADAAPAKEFLDAVLLLTAAVKDGGMDLKKARRLLVHSFGVDDKLAAELI